MAAIKIFGIDQVTGQGRWVESTDSVLNISVGNVAVRVLANVGGSLYTQAQLQALYDGQPGSNAPDVVPQLVSDYANTLATSGYKVYLGLNNWWYTNTPTGIVTANWLAFSTPKGNFGANIVSQGIITYK
jgi:hypothetical protein